jgi:tetratricopeptide (TPR) repeat protein
MLSLISENGLQNLLAAAHFRQGATLFWRGELTDAQQHLDLAMNLREESDFGRVTGETRISARIVAANVALQLGYADRARRLWIETLEGLPPRGDPFYTGFVHMYGVVLFSSLHDPQELLERANELIRLSDENPAFLGIGNFAAARALLVQGEVKEGWSRLRDATAFHQTVGFRLLRTEELEIEAELCLREGRISDALKVSMEAAKEIEEVSLYKPRILMQRADLLSQNGARAESVLAVYREALQCARNQGNRLDELKVGTHFARWLMKRDDLDEARAVIGEIYNWFTEGFDTADLREAKALLDELSR